MARYLLLLGAVEIFVACKKQRETITSPPHSVSPVLLKDIVEEHWPSPYYHFEYDRSNRVSLVSFASDYNRYDVAYDGDKISEMRNNVTGNKDRLQYSYNSEGKVEFVKYVDSTDVVYKTVDLFYDGPRLVRLDHARRTAAGFVPEKTITMSYDAGSNLIDITYHFLPFDGVPGGTSTIHFDQYDNKINVDGVSLIKDELFNRQHVFLLPGVQLQKNNPGKETRTGDGVNYTVDYTYTYNDKNAPLKRKGIRVILNTSLAGQQSEINSTFSYY
jgi:hypothetical protein